MRRELRGRARGDEQAMHLLEPLALAGREILVHHVLEPWIHANSSPSSTPASRVRALRVRVLTVPSGIARYSATSLCDMPLQYASSITSRSFSGSSSMARFTRHDTYERSARSSGPGSPDGTSGASAVGCSLRARMRSMIAFRATAYSHGAAGPRSGR